MPGRFALHAVIVGLVAGAAVAHDDRAAQAEGCATYRFTGYSRTDFPGRTADGTSVWTDEPIVAATSLPLGSYVYVPEWDTTYRVADRGRLAANHLDFLVASRAEAYAITGYRQACPL